MTKRERILAALVAAVVVLLGLRSVHSRLDETYRYYFNQEIALTDALTTEELKEAAGMEAAGKLAEWRERSLPANPTDANLKYWAWLGSTLIDAGLDNVEAKAPQIQFKPGDGRVITYPITAEGTLEEITAFLYHFYQANHLHKISKIDFEPDESGQKLGLTMTVEAWALQDSLNTDALAEGESERLALESLDAYREAIVDRNIFAVYAAPKEEAVVDDQGPNFDHAEHAFATGLVESNGKPEVWIDIRTTGDTLYLNEGETFEVGDLECRIVKIDSRSIIFEAEGQQYTVKLGRNLREGEPVAAVQQANLTPEGGGE